MSLHEVRERMAAACEAADRDVKDVTLVAVSKGRTPDQVKEVYEQGLRDFGENRAQELVEKAPHLPADIRWHFVGPLQTNKVKVVRPVVSKLHSLDRMKLAAAWAAEAGSPPALLEINLGEEPQKHGFTPSGAAAAAKDVIDLGVTLEGVMAIPPLGEAPAEHFERLTEIRDELARDHPQVIEVSAGMTEDFEEAIRAGATTIRVGRAIFE